MHIREYFLGIRGEDSFILFNPQTIWSNEYVKLSESTSGGNSRRRLLTRRAWILLAASGSG